MGSLYRAIGSPYGGPNEESIWGGQMGLTGRLDGSYGEAKWGLWGGHMVFMNAHMGVL